MAGNILSRLNILKQNYNIYHIFILNDTSIVEPNLSKEFTIKSLKMNLRFCLNKVQYLLNCFCYIQVLNH